MNNPEFKQRYVKIVRLTAKNKFTDVEKTVNEAARELAEEGHKIVSYQVTAVATTTPTYLIYTIVYE